MAYRIIPLHTGEAELESKSKFTYFRDFAVKIRYPYIAWIIEGNGQKILVDTGIGDPGWVAKHRNGRRITGGRLGDFAPTLRAHGVDPEEIRLVICTHLHYDHCCNHHLLSNATFLVQQRELAHAMVPVITQRDLYGWWQNDTPPFLSVAGRYQAIKGDREVVPGISVLLTPGHSPGHQAVLVETAAGDMLIAGDSIPLFENWETRTPSGIHVNLEEYQDTFEKIEALKDVFILPGHDSRVFEKKQYP